MNAWSLCARYATPFNRHDIHVSQGKKVALHLWCPPAKYVLLELSSSSSSSSPPRWEPSVAMPRAPPRDDDEEGGPDACWKDEKVCMRGASVCVRLLKSWPSDRKACNAASSVPCSLRNMRATGSAWPVWSINALTLLVSIVND